LNDCTKYGGASHEETDYLLGYLMVKDMSEEERDDLIKYNIGPGQIKDLPLIKEFFKVNKFTPL
jgi:hypothetical protein